MISPRKPLPNLNWNKPPNTKSMKTTILGVLTVTGALIGAATQFLTTGSIDLMSIIPAVTAGIGLIKARDQ